LKGRDPFEQKYGTQKKLSLDETQEFTLEAIPSHYYLTPSDDYSIKIRTLLKGRPTIAHIEINDQNKTIYTPIKKGVGLYELVIPAEELKEGKIYFTINAKNNQKQTFLQLAAQVNPQYFEYLNFIDSGLNAMGDLFFNHSIRFHKMGNYLIEGILYQRNTPLLKTHTIIKNTHGDQVVNLSFHGYYFFKNKVKGEFQLKGIQITKIEDSLASKGDQYIPLNLVTEDFHWEQFNSRPYINPTIEQKINNLKRFSQTDSRD